MQISVGKLSKMFEISRTTLLYYDKIGLLCPTLRSEAGYRLYVESDINRLCQIMVLRNAGVPLNQIGSIIISEESTAIGKLMKRLGELNSEIEKLKNQQQYIISILSNTSIAKNINNIDIQTIEKIINCAEINLDGRDFWHAEFEKQSPEQHHYFLSVLGFSDEEIRDFKSNK